MRLSGTWLWRKSTRELVRAGADLPLCPWNGIFTWKNNQQTHCGYPDLALRQFFRNERREPVISRRKSWPRLSPTMKFKLSRRNQNFGKPVSTTMSLTVSQYLKIILMRWVVTLTNAVFYIVQWPVASSGRSELLSQQKFPNDQCRVHG